MPRPMPRLPALTRRFVAGRGGITLSARLVLPALAFGLTLVTPAALPAQQDPAPQDAPALPQGGEGVQPPPPDDGYPDGDPQAQTGPDAPEPPMSPDRMERILRALDPEVQRNGQAWQLTIAEVMLLVVADERADRMRVIAPVRETAGLEAAELTRMMQANFDSALDARYAIARGVVWSAYIHPLTALRKNQLISGVGQVANLVRSYGTLYSSGGLIYGGGDSGAMQRELIDELLKKGEEI